MLQVIERYLACADEFLRSQPQNGYDLNGNPLQCRASTRKGTPCQRMPLPHNGYCPSHQHLAETEELTTAGRLSAAPRATLRHRSFGRVDHGPKITVVCREIWRFSGCRIQSLRPVIDVAYRRAGTTGINNPSSLFLCRLLSKNGP